VKLPDVNLLLYASDPESDFHQVASSWLEDALGGSEPVGFAQVTLLGYVRLSTNPAVVGTALSPGEAFDQVEEWLAQPPATIAHPGSRHLGIWRSLLEASGSGGNLTTDAHLAALAIEHAAALATFDGDFHRFSGLKLDYLQPGGRRPRRG